MWRGLVTNDTFHALRAYVARPASSRQPKRQHNLPSFRSRRTTPPSAQGRWSLVPCTAGSSPTEWSHALANQLLNRYGVLTRESAASENLPGGFSAIYDVLKALEESGRIRRGYFVAGLGATQFALPAAVDLLRSLRNGPPLEKPEMVSLAATDPANLYGSVLRWPALDGRRQRRNAPRVLTRSIGASVVLRNGELVAYLRRNKPNLQVFLPSEEPERSATARDLSSFSRDPGAAGYGTARRSARRHADLDDQRSAGGAAFPGALSAGCRFPSRAHGLNPAAASFRRACLGDGSCQSRRANARRRYHLPLRACPAKGARRSPVTHFETAYAPLASVHDQSSGNRPHHRASGIARQMAAHPFFRRSDPGDAHADERQLAHLPARGSDGSALAATCGWCWARRNSWRSPSMCRWPASTLRGLWSGLPGLPGWDPMCWANTFAADEAAARMLEHARRKRLAMCCSTSGFWPGSAMSSSLKSALPVACTRFARSRA